jgi:hypothetical protein
MTPRTMDQSFKDKAVNGNGCNVIIKVGKR